MKTEQIEAFKKLEKEKSTLVAMASSIEQSIVNINTEIYIMSKSCDHFEANGKSALLEMHPFKHCTICGRVV